MRCTTIEPTYRHWVSVQDVEVCVVLVLHQFAQSPLQLSIEVTIGVHISQTIFLQHFDALCRTNNTQSILCMTFWKFQCIK